MVHFHRPYTRAATRQDDNCSLQLGQVTVTPEENTKVLGVILDSKLNFQAHLKAVTTKARKNLAVIPILGKSTWGTGMQDARNIYQATVLPIAMYYSSVWHTPNKAAAEQTLTTI